jgi:hypothetical protein
MTLIRANNENLMKAGLDEVLFGPWENSQPDSVISQVFNMETHDSKFKKYQTIKGYPMLVKKNEGAAYTNADAGEAWWTELEHIAYGLYSTITHEAQADERYGVIRQFPNAMRESAEATINYYASRVFSTGFSALPEYQSSNRSSTEYLFSTSHVLKGGGTASNRPAVDADLTLTSLWAAVNAFYAMTNESGLPWFKPPKILLVPHQLQQKAIELTATATRPENIVTATANAEVASVRAVNALMKATDISPVIWPYWLGSVDEDAWYLTASPSDHQVKFVWRERPRTKMTTEDLTDNLLYFIYQRFSTGWADWKGTYGTSGA